MASTSEILASIDSRLESIETGQHSKLEEFETNIVEIIKEHTTACSAHARLDEIDEEKKERKKERRADWWKKLGIGVTLVLFGISAVGSAIYNVAYSKAAFVNVREHVTDNKSRIQTMGVKVEKNIRDIAVLEGRDNHYRRGNP